MKYLNKRDKTRQQIFDAFEELYRRHEIQDITVKKVCEAAGINRSTFYYHFDDIYRLRDDFEENFLQEMIQNMVSEPDIIINMDVNGIVAKLIEFIRSRDGLPVIVLRRNAKDFAGRLMERIFKIACEAGIPLYEENRQLIMLAMKYHMGGLVAIFSGESDGNHVVEAEDVLNQLVKFANDGVITVIRDSLKV